MSDKQSLRDVFMDHLKDKFETFEDGFMFLLNLNYYKKKAKAENTVYDDKGLTNPFIVDNYVFIVNGCRSYHLYVGVKKDDDTVESLSEIIQQPRFSMSQFPTYQNIHSYAPDGW
jgi:hypothetical protein